MYIYTQTALKYVFYNIHLVYKQKKGASLSETPCKHIIVFD